MRWSPACSLYGLPNEVDVAGESLEIYSLQQDMHDLWADKDAAALLPVYLRPCLSPGAGSGAPAGGLSLNHAAPIPALNSS